MARKVTIDDLPPGVRDRVNLQVLKAALRRLNAGRPPDSGDAVLDSLMELERSKSRR